MIVINSRKGPVMKIKVHSVRPAVGAKAVTIGVAWDEERRYIAIAVCSNLDHFSRPKARTIVEGRLQRLVKDYATFKVRAGMRGKTDVILDYKGGPHVMEYTNSTGNITATIEVPVWMLSDVQPEKQQ